MQYKQIKINIMNKKVIIALAKQEVKFQAKLGRTITLEEAIEKQEKKLTRLQELNDYPY